MSHYTPCNFNGDDGGYDAPVSQCESETCRQHYGEAQRVHLLSQGSGEIVDTRWLCLKAQQVANQVYGVTLATEPCANCGGDGYTYARSDAYDGIEPCWICDTTGKEKPLPMAA